jgi:hypothetical protein
MPVLQINHFVSFGNNCSGHATDPLLRSLHPALEGLAPDHLKPPLRCSSKYPDIAPQTKGIRIPAKRVRDSQGKGSGAIVQGNLIPAQGEEARARQPRLPVPPHRVAKAARDITQGFNCALTFQ